MTSSRRDRAVSFERRRQLWASSTVVVVLYCVLVSILSVSFMFLTSAPRACSLPYRLPDQGASSATPWSFILWLFLVRPRFVLLPGRRFWLTFVGFRAFGV
ncbi:hypothetical protein BKA65DRAFT_207632 [Rhexocercosporidium sp. MPI-PUGE-AT-0058]|nr:hypothetical protein BKA65DRAFT_207632 [Rhexocercosporidium sp. MPI-PUGE-AT-0058]